MSELPLEEGEDLGAEHPEELCAVTTCPFLRQLTSKYCEFHERLAKQKEKFDDWLCGD